MQQSRAGWSMVELLAIAGVLFATLALLAPAAEQARGQARMAQCRDRIHRLGLALFEYHGQHHVLPPGIVATHDPAIPKSAEFVAKSPVCDYPALANASGLTLMLPFLELHEPYDQYNRSVACCSAANASSVATTVSAFVCPDNPRADPAQPWGYYQKPPGFAGSDGPAATDYVFATGGLSLLTSYSPFALNTGGTDHGIPRHCRWGAGAFRVNSGTRFEMIKDGLSYTVLMGESRGGLPLGLDRNGAPLDSATIGVAADPRRSVRAAWSQGFVSDRRGLGGFGSVFAASAANAWVNLKNVLVVPGDQQAVTPQGWKAFPVNEGGVRYARGNWMASSRPSLDAERQPYDGSSVRLDEGSLQGWRSCHPGKTPLLFGDGSVRLIGDDIDPSILVALTSIRGGERVELPALCE